MRPLRLQSVGRIWDPEMICYADGTLNPDGTPVYKLSGKKASRVWRIARSLGLDYRKVINNRLHDPQPIDGWIVRYNMATVPFSLVGSATTKRPRGAYRKKHDADVLIAAVENIHKLKAGRIAP